MNSTSIAAQKTITHHVEVVLRAAAGYANGSGNAAEIGESIAFVRAYVGDMDEEPSLFLGVVKTAV